MMSGGAAIRPAVSVVTAFSVRFSTPSFGRGGVKIRRFARDPAKISRYRIVLAQRFYMLPKPRQFNIRESGMQRSMADRMHRNRIAPTAAFGNRMVPFDTPAKWAFAKPAGLRVGISHHDAR